MTRFPLVTCGAVLLGFGACAGGEPSLGAPSTNDRSQDAGSSSGSSPSEGANTNEPSTRTNGETSEGASSTEDSTPSLPGEAFAFELGQEVYIDLAGPRVVSTTNSSRTDWDLRFEGPQVFTNGGASGAGNGASFGPSTDLDLLFDTIPDVPLRADTSDGALLAWYWFSDEGVSSRYHIYGLRDGEGRLFKLQILNYYGSEGGDRVSALYTLRYAQVTEEGSEEVREITNLDATAGGIATPAGAPAGCLNLVNGEVRQLTEEQWPEDPEWHVCFQRTEVFVNGGLSGAGDVAALDLDADPETGADPGLTEAEQLRTADSEAARFEAVSHDDLTAVSALWDKPYEVLPRIGTRWLQGTAVDPSPVPGTWFVRGADGERHYALYFTSVSPLDGSSASPRVELQLKPLVSR